MADKLNLYDSIHRLQHTHRELENDCKAVGDLIDKADDALYDEPETATSTIQEERYFKLAYNHLEHLISVARDYQTGLNKYIKILDEEKSDNTQQIVK